MKSELSTMPESVREFPSANETIQAYANGIRGVVDGAYSVLNGECIPAIKGKCLKPNSVFEIRSGMRILIAMLRFNPRRNLKISFHLTPCDAMIGSLLKENKDSPIYSEVYNYSDGSCKNETLEDLAGRIVFCPELIYLKTAMNTLPKQLLDYFTDIDSRAKESYQGFLDSIPRE